MNELSDRCKGVLFGQAIGDALGLGTEFMAKAEVSAHYPHGLSAYGQIVRDAHRGRWAAGDWTDDTDQMLCILDSLLDRQAVDVLDIARRIHGWATGGGLGIGQLVWTVVHAGNFLTDPQAAARSAWEATGRRAAPNGGVMRTSVLGVWRYESLAEVRNNAEQVCRITHYDPRCVGSCVAVCTAISLLLQGQHRFPAILDRVREAAAGYAPGIDEYLERAAGGTLDDLDLDEGLNPGEPDRIGYTLKTLAAGFWALGHAPSYREGVLRVIHEGGDADTNAAVAGAMLGARDGFASLPRDWVEKLHRGPQLESRANRLLAGWKRAP